MGEEEELFYGCSWAAFFSKREESQTSWHQKIPPSVLFGDLYMFFRPWISKRTVNLIKMESLVISRVSISIIPFGFIEISILPNVVVARIGVKNVTIFLCDL